MADKTYLYLDKEFNSTQTVTFASLGEDKNGLTPPSTFVTVPDVMRDNSRGLNAAGKDIGAHDMYILEVTITGFTIKAKMLNTSAVKNYHNIRIIGE